MVTVREAFLSRVRSLMEVLNHSSNFDEGNIDAEALAHAFLTCSEKKKERNFI